MAGCVWVLWGGCISHFFGVVCSFPFLPRISHIHCGNGGDAEELFFLSLLLFLVFLSSMAWTGIENIH